MESPHPKQAAPTNTRHDTGAGPDTQPSGAASTEKSALAFLAPPQAPDELGRLGPYRILGELGHGGMGMVFRAEDPQLKRQIALKVMLPQYAANPLAMKRFLREAEAQAAVEHDHIIPIFQVGEDRGTPFIAMPLLKGQTLAAALRASPRLPISEVIRIGREMAEGLAAAHEKGLIHRDIKPGNVWLEGERRRVKILDFGLARADAEQSAEGDEPITASGTIVGTPSYMAPEQARALPVDFRTDLFSLGVVLYQMATGHLPFTGANTMAILTALAVDNPRPPRELTPELPPSLSVLIQRLLAKNPSQRPQSAHAVAEDLRQHELAMSASVQAIPLGALPEVVPEVWSQLDETETNEVVHRPTPSKRTSTPVSREAQPSAPRYGVPVWVWAVATMVGFLAVVGGAAVVFQQVTKITTPKGTLVIESNDPDVEVIVKKDGAVLVDKTKQREIELKVGDGYTIELAEKKDGLRLSTDKFTITKDGKSTVKVFVEKPKEAAKPKDKTTTPEPEDTNDRRAAVLFGPYAELKLRMGNQHVDVAPGQPLPKEPFSIAHISIKPQYPQLPEGFAAKAHAAILSLNGLVQFHDSADRLHWTEHDLARLAKSPAQKTLTTFVGQFELSAQAWDALRQFPQLNWLMFRGNRATDESLAGLANLKVTTLQVSGLGASGQVTAAGWQSLLKGGKLRSLGVFNSKGPETSVAKLIASHPTLEAVHFSGTAVNESALRELARSPKLTTLTLKTIQGPFEGALKDLVATANLTTLDFGGSKLSPAAYAPLATLTQVRWLGLTNTGATEADVQKLAAALPRCVINWDKGTTEPSDVHYREAKRFLELDPTGINAVVLKLPDGQEVQFKSVTDLPPGLFRFIGITNKTNSVPFGNADLKRLADLPDFTMLIVNVNQLDTAGLRPLLGWKSTLTKLRIGASSLDDDGLAVVGQLTELKALLIDRTGVTDAGLKQLVGLTKLEQLTLDRTGITDGAVPHLAALKNLALLQLNDTRVTAAGVKQLQEALPKCKIEWTPPKSEDPARGALVFDGKTTHVRLPFSPTDAAPYTVEAWVKFDAPTTAGYTSIASAFNPGRGISLFRSPQGNIRFGERVGQNQDTANEAKPSGQVGWMHVAGVWDGKQSRLYVNGVRQPHEKREPLPQAQIDAQDQPWLLGASQPVRAEPVQNFFAGQMREVRFTQGARYDKDFTPATRHEPDKDTYALYRCDEGQGDELKDSSGGNRHGKIVGATWVKAAGTPTHGDRKEAKFALLFDGEKSIVTIPTLSRNDSKVLTVEAYLTPSRIGTDSEKLQTVLQMNGQHHLQLSQTGNAWRGFQAVGVNALGQTNNGTARVGQRVHVAMTIKQARAALFVDGEPAILTNSRLKSERNNETGTTLGGGTSLTTGDMARYFAGTIDEVRISIGARYDGPFTPAARLEKDANTLALYHFDEGQGDKLTDSSGNGHHGKITGAKWVVGTADPDRKAAEWVLSIGGTVGVNGNATKISAVAELPKTPFTLTHLFLTGNQQVSDAGLAVFQDCKNLTDINLNNTAVTDIGLSHFKNCDRVANLHLTGTKLTDAGLVHFKNCKNLRALFLSVTAVTDAGLANFKDCKQLTNLTLSKTAVTDTGLAHFIGCKNLMALYLSDTAVSDAGLAHFKDCKNLTQLHARATKVTANGLADFHAAVPGCKISWDGGVIEPKVVANSDPDRRAAEFILQFPRDHAIAVQIDDVDRWIGKAEDLPKGPFRLTSVFVEWAKTLDDAALANFAGCRHLKVLKLWGTPVTEKGLAHFAECRGLTELSLTTDTVTNAALKVFEPCEKIERLRIQSRNVTDEGMVVFRGRRLKSLALRHTPIGDRTLDLFPDSPDLELLDLGETKITDAGLKNFAKCKRIEELALFRTGVTDAGLAHFAGCTQLKRLVLAVCPGVTDAGVKELVRLTKLVKLDLQKTKVTAAGLDVLKKALPQCRIEHDGGSIEPTAPADRAVAEWVLTRRNKPHIAVWVGDKLVSGVTQLPIERFALAWVNIVDPDFGDDDLVRFAGLPKLSGLTLHTCSITNAGLTKLRDLPALADLNLERTKVTDAGLPTLAKMPGLTKLVLSDNPITDDGLKSLHTLTGLKQLGILKTKVTKAGLDAFHVAVPGCKIVYDGGTIEPK